MVARGGAQMSQQIKCLVLTGLLLVLSACASGPTVKELTNANYGRDMKAEECVKIAEELISNNLKDPGSAHYKNQPCFKGYWKSAPLFGQSLQFGWLQKGEVNAKNSFGGYTGFSPYMVLIRDGSAVRYCIADNDGVCIPRNVQ
jgi:hypothetical protein